MIGARIKLLRKHHNKTQDEFAEDLNVSRTTISNWENENTMPDIMSLKKISEFFHITLDDLVKDGPIMVVKEFKNLAYTRPLQVEYGSKFLPKHATVKSYVNMETGEITFALDQEELEAIRLYEISKKRK